jgi:ABC-2 type transport system permease protein
MVKKSHKKGKQFLLNLLISLLLLVGINYIASFVFTRFDLSAEKRFTLSPATIKLVKELDDVVYVKVYLDGEFPAGFRRLQQATKEMLDELKAYAGTKIEYEFINPSANTDAAARNAVYKQLIEKGLQPTNLQEKAKGQSSQQIIFPGALLSYKSEEISLQLLKNKIGTPPEVLLNNSVEGLEYDFAKTIRDLTAKAKPVLGFIEGHGELTEIEVGDISKTLSESYQVKRIKIAGRLSALKSCKGIIIAKPDSLFSEQDKFVIDQFIMNGGKVLWLIDGINASMDSLQKRAVTIAIANATNLDDQLFHYGARINSNLLLDLQAAPIPIITGFSGNQPKQSLLPWFFFPLITPTQNHPVVNNLNAIFCQFVSSIDTVGAKGIKKTVLLASSNYTRQLFSPVQIGLNVIKEQPDMRQYNKHKLAVSLLLEGQFKSVFANRIPTAIAGSKEIAFKDKSVATKMILVADGDLIKNTVKKSTGQILPLGYDRYTGQTYGNKTFLLNAIDYMCDETGLIAVRAKEIKLRLLDRNKVDEERFQWQLITLTLPLLLLLIIGLLQFYFRKRKYARLES